MCSAEEDVTPVLRPLRLRLSRRSGPSCCRDVAPLWMGRMRWARLEGLRVRFRMRDVTP